MTLTDRLLEGILSAAIDTGGPLDPADTYVGLYTAGPTTTPPATVADFTLPDATDAPAKLITAWTAPYKLVDGRWAVQGNLLTWRLPDADNPFTAVGHYLADALTAGNVLAYKPIAPGVNLPDATRSLSVVVRVTLDPNGQWDSTILIDS